MSSTDTQKTGEQGASREEKFFGVSTPVQRPSQMSKEDREAEPPEIEIEDQDAPPVEKSADKPDDKAKAKSKSDEDDDELSEYSEKVQKRIKKMTWEKNEERRQREAAEALRDEAVRATQTLMQRNQQYEQIIATGEAELVKRMKQGAEAAVNSAKAEYRKAYEEGDTDAIVEAQEKLLQAQAEMVETNRYDADYQRRVQQFQQGQNFQQQGQYQQPRQAQPSQQAQQAAQQPQQPPPPTPEAASWAEKNPWFHDPNHYDMTAMAYGVHEDLVRNKGVRPDTPEYYAEIDKVMHQRFPEYFGQATGGTASSTAQGSQSTVVAPASRNNGAKSRKVKLTPTAVALAKKLGLTNEQYANQMLKDRGIT